MCAKLRTLPSKFVFRSHQFSPFIFIFIHHCPVLPCFTVHYTTKRRKRQEGNCKKLCKSYAKNIISFLFVRRFFTPADVCVFKITGFGNLNSGILRSHPRRILLRFRQCLPFPADRLFSVRGSASPDRKSALQGDA